MFLEEMKQTWPKMNGSNWRYPGKMISRLWAVLLLKRHCFSWEIVKRKNLSVKYVIILIVSYLLCVIFKIKISILVSLEILRNLKLDTYQATCQCSDLRNVERNLIHVFLSRTQKILNSITSELSWNVDGTWSVVNGYKIRTLYSKNQQPKFICWGNSCVNPIDLSSADKWVTSW